MEARSVLDLLDLTLLDRDADEAALDALCIRANEHRPAAVCVFAEHAPYVGSRLDDGIALAAVAGGFPVGSESSEEIAEAVREAVESGAEEVDCVLEPRDDEDGNQTIIERTAIWDDDLVQTWPVYGTYGRPTLELDLPQAEELGIFPKDLWTFTVVGDRARLEATQIIHGYTFEVFEDYESDFTITLSPSNQDEFSLRRQ